MIERRFPTEFRESASDEPGLVLEDDGTVNVVQPGGARTALPANGGSPTVIGPFEVNFDDPGIDSPPGIVFHDVLAGTWILNIWTVLIAPWDGVSSAYLYTPLCVTSDPGDNANILIDDVLNSTNWPPGSGVITNNDARAGIGDPSEIAKAVADCQLRYHTQTDAPPIAGKAEIYALVLAP